METESKPKSPKKAIIAIIVASALVYLGYTYVMPKYCPAQTEVKTDSVAVVAPAVVTVAVDTVAKADTTKTK